MEASKRASANKTAAARPWRASPRGEAVWFGWSTVVSNTRVCVPSQSHKSPSGEERRGLCGAARGLSRPGRAA
jgi:hypothetical protein